MKRLLAILVICAGVVTGQTEYALKDGDTVVFYGDSITDQRLYTTFVETFTLTRFPERKIRFVHSGWGGDRVSGGGGGPIDVRLQRDVIPYHPTVLTIMLGMNDGRYRAMDTTLFDEFKKGYEHILDVAQKAQPDVRLTLIQPSPYDDVTRPPLFPGGYNAVLKQYSNYLRELAEARHAALADLNTPVVDMLARANSTDAPTALKILPDRVHPGASGHLIMAGGLLRAWNAPAVVSEVEIDSSNGQAAKSVNTAITSMKTGEVLAWTQEDRALPMPVDMADAAMALAVKSSDFVQRFNQELLTVKGLTGARYQLSINGAPVATLTAQELAGGVNLATLNTPMQKQAKAVHDLTIKRTGIHQTRWRQLQVPLATERPQHLQSAMDALDALENDLIAMQRAAAKPLACTYELRLL